MEVTAKKSRWPLSRNAGRDPAVRDGTRERGEREGDEWCREAQKQCRAQSRHVTFTGSEQIRSVVQAGGMASCIGASVD